MNMETAQQIADILTQLAVAVSRYQAQFGRDYRLVTQSPLDAHRLAKQIAEYQASIARRLELQALHSAVESTNSWWNRTDIMDTAVLCELGKHVLQLIIGCGYPNNTYNLTVIQTVIAGFIQPDIRYKVIYEIEDISATG